MTNEPAAPTSPDIGAILRKRRHEVLRVAGVLQEIASQGFSAEEPVRFLVHRLRYAGNYLCCDNILADILAPEEPLAADVFPEDLKAICDLLDARENYTTWDPRLQDVPPAKELFAQLAQILLELADAT